MMGQTRICYLRTLQKRSWWESATDPFPLLLTTPTSSHLSTWQLGVGGRRSFRLKVESERHSRQFENQALLAHGNAGKMEGYLRQAKLCHSSKVLGCLLQARRSRLAHTLLDTGLTEGER